MVNNEKKIVWTTKKVQEAAQKLNDGYILPNYEIPFFEKTVGLRKKSISFGFTGNEYDEYVKCKLDVTYFANNYCFIKVEDGSFKLMNIRDYQYDILDLYDNNKYSILMASRQVGKTIMASIYILHFMLFNNTKNVLLAANILDTSKEVLGKIREIYSYLPFFLQQGIDVWSVTQMKFQNGCRAKAFAMTKTASIGNAADLVYVDEFAYINNSVANKFYKSIFPTLASIENSKMIITSTPNGFNLFHKLLTDSEREDTDPLKNNFGSLRVYWHQVKGRNVTYLKINPHLLPQFGLTLDEVMKQCNEKYNPNGKVTSNEIPIVELKYDSDKGLPIINIQNSEKLTFEVIGMTEFINNNDEVVHCTSISSVSTWKIDTTKDIGGEDNFNSEFDLRFSSGSKNVLSETTIERLMENKKPFNHLKHDVFKKLRWDYSALKFVEGFDENIRKKIHVMLSIDISEGLGQDYSVINMFKLDYKSMDLINEQKDTYQTLSDFFQLIQFGMFRTNIVSHAQLAEMAYLLIFEFFDPDQVKVTVEYNNDGKAFFSEIKNVFENDNDYSGYVMLKFKHRLDAINKSYGLKVGTLKNQYVKDYQARMENQDFIICNEVNIKEVGTFIKHTTTAGNTVYKGDGSCDDCVVPDTLITTNGGIKMIKDINVGDMVLTHKGRYRKVLKVGNRHSDYIYKIKSNNKLDLSITNNHELFLFEKKNYTNKDRKLKFLKEQKWLSIDDGIDIKKHYTAFIPNQEVKNLNYIDLYEYCDKKKFIIKNKKIYSIINGNINHLNPTQNPINRYLEIDNDMCYIFGYYLAEGSRNEHQINFSSHINERLLRKKVNDIFINLGLFPFKTNGLPRNSGRITISSKILSNFFKVFGKSDDKKLPNFCNFLPDDKLRNIIYGYFMGDGGFSQKGIRSFSISPSISFFIYESLVKLGYKPSLKKQNQTKKTTYPNSKKYGYVVNVNDYDKNDILSYMEESILIDKNIEYPLNVSDKKSYQKSIDNYLIGKIRNIEKIEYNDIVYNLEVDDDNSYVANGVIVHNCAMTLVNMSQGWKSVGFKEMLADYHQENGREVIKNLVNSILNKDMRVGTDYTSFFNAKNNLNKNSAIGRIGGKIDVKNLF
jgi:intein/homing endonuclease